MRIALIGGVSSTLTTLFMLHKHGFLFVDVYGYEPKNPKIVSGYRSLEDESIRFGYSYNAFDKINDHAADIINAEYDYIFVVGLSQLVSNDIIISAKKICIGFHPTKLPKGRGRAPMAWLILEENEGAATFFQIKPNQAADAGPILEQSFFSVDKNDTVATLERKVLDNIAIALDHLLPKLFLDNAVAVEQDNSMSSEYGVRKPQDGYINWQDSCEDIKKNIRAAVFPHPGAFAFVGHESFEVWLPSRQEPENIKGVIGRVLVKDDDNYLIQAGDGCVWIETGYALNVGMQLGVYGPYEIYLLNKKVKALEDEIFRIVNKIDCI
jgi:methionyl-tRNA formyltransferase